MELKTENAMGEAPVGKLIWKLSFPLILSLLVQGLYGLVDSMFVSRLGENALTAISLCMSVQYLVVGAGAGISVGTNAILSRVLGEKDQERASRAAGNGRLVLWLTALLLMLFGIWVIPPFLRIQTDISEVLEMSISYGQIICILGFASMHQTYMERLLSATGKTKLTMVSMISGAMINCILDPIMIFGWFGLPAMGIAGAAYATVIAQMIAAGIAWTLNLKWNRDIHWNRAAFRPKTDVISEIIKIGIPVALSQCLISILAFGMNAVLLPLSSVAPAVYVVYIRLQTFATMPANGISNAIISLVAYNYGARKKERILKIMKTGILWTILFTLISVVIFQIFPGMLLGMFDASSAMLSIGIPAFHIISVGMPIMCFVTMLVSFLQAMGKGTPGFLLAIAQAILLPGVAWLLGLSGNITLVWASFPIVEGMRVLIIIPFVIDTYRQKIKVMNGQDKMIALH